MAKSLEVQAIIRNLEWSDELGAGAKQRDVVGKSLTNLVKYYIDLKMESGYTFAESTDSVMSEIKEVL